MDESVPLATGQVLGIFLAIMIGLSVGVLTPFSVSAQAQDNTRVHISPNVVSLSVGDTLRFDANGGVPPYFYSVLRGPGKIDQATGIYAAPFTPNTAVVQVRDITGQTDLAVIQINARLKILSSNNRVELGGSIYFTGIGGTPPYTYTLLSGTGQLNKDKGIFTPSGDYHFEESLFGSDHEKKNQVEVQIKDTHDNTATISVKVVPALEATPQYEVTTVNDTIRILRKGGLPPYTSRVVSGEGTIDSATGDFTASKNPGTVVIQTMDALQRILYTFIRVNSQLTILPDKKSIVQGENWAFHTFGGIPPYRYDVISGPGRIDSQGVYTAVGGLGIARIQVRDVLDNEANAEALILSGNFDTRNLSLGDTHSCALFQTGAKCWGDNHYGQLGIGNTEQKAAPSRVIGMQQGVIAITSGHRHSCALLAVGAVACWGDNSSGQLGLGKSKIGKDEKGNPIKFSTVPHIVPEMSQGVISVSAGQNHTCAVKDGMVFCWGENHNHQLGNPTQKESSVPLKVVGIETGATSVVAGAMHSCAIINKGVKCWGSNVAGQLGATRDILYSKVPVQTEGLKEGIQAIDTKGNHTCALLSGKMKCWGYDGGGQIGSNSRNNKPVPVEVLGLTQPVESMAVGYDHTCAKLINSEIVCWGYDHYGQLGGKYYSTYVTTPRPVAGLTGKNRFLAAGNDITCVLNEKSYTCWGRNNHGQFGNQTLNSSRVPIPDVPIN